jgi:hypothetical protein
MDYIASGLILTTYPRSAWFPAGPPDGLDAPPLLFAAATEMLADLANQQLHYNAPSLPHRLHLLSESQPQASDTSIEKYFGPAPTLVPPPYLPTGRPRAVIKSWDVYVDDFIVLVQGNRRHWRHMLLHAPE